MTTSRLRTIVNFLLDCMADFSVQSRYAGELDYVRIRFSRLSEFDLALLQKLVPDAEISAISAVTNDSTQAQIYHHYIDLV